MRAFRNLGLSVVLAAAFLIPSSILTATVRAAEEKKQKTELYHKMETIDEGMKKLKRTMRKSDQNEVSIKVCGEIIEAAKFCREQVPSKAAKMPEADRKKVVAEYQASMDKLIETIGQMKKAFEANDLDAAKKLHKTLKDMEEDGHDKFMDDADKENAKDKK